MLKRLVYAAVGVVGLALIGLSIASATLWRADDVLRASATARTAILVTDPGVLEMAGDPVTITASAASGSTVSVAIGRDTDVAGWVGTDEHERVSGLAGWHDLALADPSTGGPATPAPSGFATARPSGSPSAAPTPTVTTGVAAAEGDAAETATAGEVPDPTTSDMWVAQASGTGSATLTWQAAPGRWSLLVVGATASGTAAPPTLELAWPRTVTTPYLVPGSVAGGVLLLLGLALLGNDLRRSRTATEWTPVLTEPIPVVGSPGVPALTRRQLREMQALAQEAGRRASARSEEPATATGEVATAEPPAGSAGGPAAANPAEHGAEHRPSRRAERAAGRRGADSRDPDEERAGADGGREEVADERTAPGEPPRPAHPGGGAAEASDERSAPARPLTRRELREQRGSTTSEHAVVDEHVAAAPRATVPAWTSPTPTPPPTPERGSVPGTAPTTTPAAEPGHDADAVAGTDPDQGAVGPGRGRPSWLRRRRSSGTSTGTPSTAPEGSGVPERPEGSEPVRPPAHAASVAAAPPGAPGRPWHPLGVAGQASAPGRRGTFEPLAAGRRPGTAVGPARPPVPGADGAGRESTADASRADAWRRAWGLPPLDVETEEDGR